MGEDPLSNSATHAIPLSLKSKDGLSLFGRAWVPPAGYRANIILVHSLGEHSGRYEHIARHFLARDYAVYGIDFRGHGRSQGRRGHVNHFQDYLQDLTALVKHIHQESSPVPLFLIGHSVGGLISLLYALRYQENVSTVIIACPAFRGSVQISGWRLMWANLLSLVSPTLTLYNNLDPYLLSQDEAVVKAYRSDPLVHNEFTARWAVEYLKASDWIMSRANRLAVSALILQSGNDQIVDPSGAREFFDRIGLEDKYYIEYETLYHEIFNESEALSVLGDIEAWLIPRLQPEVGALSIA